MPRGSFGKPIVEVDANDTRLVQGTDEQQAVWDTLLNTDAHVIVEAVAGSGKTFAITQYAMRTNGSGLRVGLIAFNKHIATELSARMTGQSNVDCMTYHSLGYKAVRASMRGVNVRVDQYKVLSYLDTLRLPVKDSLQKLAKYRIGTMVSYAKTYGHGDSILEHDMEVIEDRHDVDMPAEVRACIMDYVPRVLKYCADEMRTVDFDDMVWLPYVHNMQVPKYDVLCVDEYQDTGHTQQWLAVRGGVRVCAVGDPRQAIYSFRGCDGTGFDKLRKELQNVVTLPLTLTRRCPKSHVRLAQVIVPKIRAMDDAPEGVVRVVRDVDAAVSEMRAGDLVVCRVNAELVGTAYKLLKRGVKAVVRGRDIGAGMTKLIDAAVKRSDANSNVNTFDLPVVMQEAGTITNEQVAKYLALPNGRGEMRASNAQDKYGCLCELAEECKSVSEVRAVIEKLFAEFEDDGTPKHAVVLGTVHRTKGLEGNRVYVLRPDLIPHPMAKKQADQHAEMNLLYVATTRAKFDAASGCVGELVFVGCAPSMYDGMINEPRSASQVVKTTPDTSESRINTTDERGKENRHAGEDSEPALPTLWDEDEVGVPMHRRWKN